MNEYLALCLQAGEYRRYAIKLAELGCVDEANILLFNISFCVRIEMLAMIFNGKVIFLQGLNLLGRQYRVRSLALH